MCCGCSCRRAGELLDRGGAAGEVGLKLLHAGGCGELQDNIR